MAKKKPCGPDCRGDEIDDNKATNEWNQDTKTYTKMRITEHRCSKCGYLYLRTTTPVGF